MKNNTRTTNYLGYVLGLAFKQKRSMAFLAVLTIVAVGARLTEPYLYKVVIDTLTLGLMGGDFTAGQIQLLLWMVGSLLVLAVPNLT